MYGMNILEEWYRLWYFLQVAHGMISEKLLDYIYNGFLVSVFSPALHKVSLQQLLNKRAIRLVLTSSFLMLDLDFSTFLFRKLLVIWTWCIFLRFGMKACYNLEWYKRKPSNILQTSKKRKRIRKLTLH